MFKYFREMRELRKKKLLFQTVLLSKMYDLVDGFPDIVELAKRAKELNTEELQQMLVTELVTYMKKNEEKSSEE